MHRYRKGGQVWGPLQNSNFLKLRLIYRITKNMLRTPLAKSNNRGTHPKKISGSAQDTCSIVNKFNIFQLLVCCILDIKRVYKLKLN